jgi:hypothetical protein
MIQGILTLKTTSNAYFVLSVSSLLSGFMIQKPTHFRKFNWNTCTKSDFITD